MDITKLSADLQTAVDAVLQTDTERSDAAAHLAVAEDAYNTALAHAQALREAFTSALNEVMPAPPARKHLSV